MDAIELAKIAVENRVPACFVRSKCDSDLTEHLLGNRINEIAQLNQTNADDSINKCKSVLKNYTSGIFRPINFFKKFAKSRLKSVNPKPF